MSDLPTREEWDRLLREERMRERQRAKAAVWKLYESDVDYIDRAMVIAAIDKDDE